MSTQRSAGAVAIRGLLVRLLMLAVFFQGMVSAAHFHLPEADAGTLAALSSHKVVSTSLCKFDRKTSPATGGDHDDAVDCPICQVLHPGSAYLPPYVQGAIVSTRKQSRERVPLIDNPLSPPRHSPALPRAPPQFT